MLKRPIKYKDFDGNDVEETFYFNLSGSELVELEASNIVELYNRIVKAQDKEALIREFKRLILMSYGVKSEDGKRFIKSEQLRDEFAQTAAYDSLFMELCTSDDAGAAFFQGILPAEAMAKLAEAQQQDKPAGPPPVPKR